MLLQLTLTSPVLLILLQDLKKKKDSGQLFFAKQFPQEVCFAMNKYYS